MKSTEFRNADNLNKNRLSPNELQLEKEIPVEYLDRIPVEYLNRIPVEYLDRLETVSIVCGFLIVSQKKLTNNLVSVFLSRVILITFKDNIKHVK